MGSTRPTHFLLLLSLAALLAVAVLGCAQGAGSPDGGGGGDGGGRRDGGMVVRHDAGHVTRDAGGSGSCDPHGAGASCQDATEIGPVAVGDTVQSMVGLVAVRTAQWLKVSFPPTSGGGDGGVPTAAGGGSPTIHFLQNEGDAYRFEIRDMCAGIASCGGGGGDGGLDMASNLTDWSFADDPALSDPGDGQFSTRNTPWPEAVYIRVFPTTNPGCGHYQLEITR